MTECVVGIALGGIALWLCSSKAKKGRGRDGHKESVEAIKKAALPPPKFWDQQGLRLGRAQVFWNSKALSFLKPDGFRASSSFYPCTSDTLRPHVVISTKFEESWFTFSQDFKELLMAEGCTVYNPNTDNEETYKEAPGFASANLW